MTYQNKPVEWESTTPESMYYVDQTMDNTDLNPFKVAGVVSRVGKCVMSEPAMIGIGATTRARDKMNDMNNSTSTYSLGRTF